MRVGAHGVGGSRPRRVGARSIFTPSPVIYEIDFENKRYTKENRIDNGMKSFIRNSMIGFCVYGAVCLIGAIVLLVMVFLG